MKFVFLHIKVPFLLLFKVWLDLEPHVIAMILFIYLKKKSERELHGFFVLALSYLILGMTQSFHYKNISILYIDLDILNHYILALLLVRPLQMLICDSLSWYLHKFSELATQLNII